MSTSISASTQLVRPRFCEIGGELEIDVAQMRHVGERVGELRVAERPPRPVGEAVRLVERVAGDALDQLVVGDRIAIAEHHGGDLGVEDRMRDLAWPCSRRFRCPAARHGRP